MSTKYLYQLPLDIRGYIAKMDFEALMIMYTHDIEFRKYVNSNHMFFTEQINVMQSNVMTRYIMNNIEYHKHNNGCIGWYLDGKLHNKCGPAIIYINSAKAYYQYGKRHREGGPAVMYQGGGKEYYINDHCHRLDGPAIVRTDGYIAYYINGKLHNLNGPAVIHCDSTEEYWLYGKQINQ